MKPAYVLGNGRSRLKIKLESLRSKGTIFGCNALYRDFTPDVLVSTDGLITTEIESTGYQNKHEFWTRIPALRSKSNKIVLNYGYSSGPIAVSMAADRGHPLVYMIGFDLTGINGLVNNVYAGTHCYKKVNEEETFYGNWCLQLTAIMRDQYPKTQFIRVVEPNSYQYHEWQWQPNYSECLIDDFINSINNSSCQRQNE